MEACVLALFVLRQTQSHRGGLCDESRLKPAADTYFSHFHLIFLKMPPLKHSPLGPTFLLLPTPSGSVVACPCQGGRPLQKKRVKKFRREKKIAQTKKMLWDLPEEVLVHILSFLSTRELGWTLPLVCRLLRSLADDDALWKVTPSYLHPPPGPLPLLVIMSNK